MFLLCSIVIGLLLSIAGLLFQNTLQFTFSLMAVLVVSIPAILMEKANLPQFSRVFFLFGIVALISFNAVLNALNGVETFVQVLMMPVALSSLVIARKNCKKTFFIMISTLSLALFSLTHFLEGSQFTREFWVSFINIMILFSTVYYIYFKSRMELKRSFSRSVELNRKLQEEKDNVKQTQNILFSMIDNLPLHIAMFDSKGRLLALNQLFAQDFGYEIRDLVGNKYSKVLYPDFLKSHSKYIKQSLNGNKVDFDEAMNLPKQKDVNAFGSYVPIFNSKGKVEAVTLFAVNSTSIKKKEEQLQILNERKNNLFSLIAHDLRSPLNLINGLVFLNKDEESTSSERKLQADRLSKNLEGLSLLLDNTLMWAQNQIEGRKERKEYFRISNLIDQETRVYQEIINEKSIYISNDMPQDDTIYFEENILRIVFRNIFINALKYTPHNGTISINCKRNIDSLILSVKDSGIGMSQEQINRILQGELIESKEGTNGEKGSGLGLYLGIENLQETGAKIDIHSTENQGTTISIQIPLKKNYKGKAA